MNRTTKLVLMFAPLVLFFIGLALVVNDLRHPATTTDHCIVTATGADVQPYKGKSPFIYKHSDNLIHDVSLRCDRQGVLLLNDTQLRETPIESGEEASLTTKEYHYLPKRWMVSVHTGKPEGE